MKCECVRPWNAVHVSPNEIAVCCRQTINTVDTKKYNNLKDAMLTEYRDFRVAMLESSKENKLPEKYCSEFCDMKLNVADCKGTEFAKEIEAGNVDYFAPFEVTLVTDFGCNLKCKMCYIFEFVDIKDKVSKDFAISIIDNMKNYKDSKIMILGGEPQYSIYAKEITQYAIANDITIGFISNFSVFDQKLFDTIDYGKLYWMNISANAVSNETRKLIMGDNFDKFIVNVEQFLTWRHEYQKSGHLSEVIVSFVVMTSNYHEIIDAIDFYLKYPVNLNFTSLDHEYDGRYEEVYTMNNHQDYVMSILVNAVQYVNTLIDAKDFKDTDIPCQMNIEKFRMKQLNEIKKSLVLNIQQLKHIIKNENNFDEPLFDIEIIKKKSTKRLLK